MLDTLETRKRPRFLIPADESRCSRTLPSAPQSAAVARSLVRTALETWQMSDTDAIDTALLIVSELVANAVEHANTDGSSLRIIVTRAEPGRIKVGVTDFDRTPPIPATADANQEHGRGLALVNEVAEEWGVTLYRWGKQVWASIAA
ncbi:ATP-binding protein [Streptomyces filamentosus]|uniref:Histidine kinase/HSP90-like ATPase domain-containing protein n=1 Tax=Streptomyces filamentosus TaxID=67294 RepID=A0A919EPT7_STRFL|nr:ATP-binding protein [Streptomyces filamentosus]GHG13266.1 hypothetical protein GCM10017667_53820 [Streptomyces filamentosus]